MGANQMFARPLGWMSVVVAGGFGFQLIMAVSPYEPASVSTTTPIANEVSQPFQPVAQDDDIDTDFGPSLDGALVESEYKCVDCHWSEYQAWGASPHYESAFQHLRGTGDNLEEYAEAVGLDRAEITTKGACIQCHGTPYQNSWSNVTLLTSVTCEACHNPSGGDEGWLNIHASYGANGIPRSAESESHYKVRADRCAKSGQIRSSDVYAMAKRCTDCHLAKHEELFNAGHEQGRVKFDFDNYTSAKIRHNFHFDGDNNAHVSTLWQNPQFDGGERTVDGRLRLYSVLFPMISAEVGLANVANIDDAGGDFAEAAVDQIKEGVDELEDACEALIGEDEFKELNDKLEDVAKAEYEVLDADTDERADLVAELEPLRAELQELESAVGSQQAKDIWDIYKTAFLWHYQFDEEDVETVFEYDYADSGGLDYSQDKAQEAAKALSMKVETFAVDNANGSALSDLEVPEIDE